MMRPVTSTSVATNGADAVAGSRSILRKAKCMREPERVPQRKMKMGKFSYLHRGRVLIIFCEIFYHGNHLQWA